jgi:hypothetical protein
VTARFSAPRAERIEGESMVFERGTYTACEPLPGQSGAPAPVQVKSARIIHNNSEKTIYYENSTLEFAGIPVATSRTSGRPIRREAQDGFLAPHLHLGTSIGQRVSRAGLLEHQRENYDVDHHAHDPVRTRRRDMSSGAPPDDGFLQPSGLAWHLQRTQEPYLPARWGTVIAMVYDGSCRDGRRGGPHQRALALGLGIAVLGQVVPETTTAFAA